MKIKIIEDGPYLVSESIPLDEKEIINENGDSKYKQGCKHNVDSSFMLCRCGNSKDFPFCDGSHQQGFDGKEVANKDPFSKDVITYNGENLRLEDAECLCSSARFCHNRKENVWDCTENNMDDIAVKMACECPSGRLVMYDKLSNTPIEPAYEPSITVLKDTNSKHSGPLFVKGGIQIVSAAGEDYKPRNRVTLCCCGKSKNKPFCDSSHLR